MSRGSIYSLMGFVLCLALILAVVGHRTKTVTNTVTVQNTATVKAVGPEEAPVGTMTAKEYNSIAVGQDVEYLDNNYGAWPSGNVEDDHRTFYPAAEGGRYIFYFKDGRIERKEYVR